ncbi:MAG: LamG-like jellyroll fold domain-containing protein [Myxococcota bacterium]
MVRSAQLVGIGLVLSVLLSCEGGVATQVILEFRADPTVVARAARVRFEVIREGADPVVREAVLMGPDAQTTFPLTLPLSPLGGDARRRFHVVADLFDASGTLFQRQVRLGGFTADERRRVVVRFDPACDEVLECESEQTCFGGTCAPACVVPVALEGRPETPLSPCARFQKRLTFDASGLRADVERFPLLVQVVDEDLADHARPDGADIAFSSLEGALLPHEIAHFDPSTGALSAWVLVEALRGGTPLELQMSFGGAPVVADLEALWSTFAAVWHLDEGTSRAAGDASSFQNTAAVERAESQRGIAHRARQTGERDDRFSREFEQLSGFDLGLTSFTVSVWLFSDDGEGRVFAFGGNDAPGVFLAADGYALVGDVSITSELVPIEEDHWTHLVLVVDRERGEVRHYVNGSEGAQTADIADLGDVSPRGVAPLTFGGAGGCCFPRGAIDELWVDRSAWTDAKVAAVYANQQREGLSLGPLEEL